MGGDKAPGVIFEGILLCAEEIGPATFQLYGDPKALDPLLKEVQGKIKSRAVSFEIVPAEDVIPSDMKPAVALRSHRNSSLGLAVRAVREQKADAILSAGNTGAFMALTKVMLGMLAGIDRPAIATFLPTMRGRSLVLDLGASAECSARNLVEFAFMGEALAQVCLEISAPNVSILNIGSEDTKGNHVVQEAASILKKTQLLKNYQGFVEGSDLSVGTADVIVTDGFTGNVALKTAEGTIDFLKNQINVAMKHSIGAKVGALLLYQPLKKVFSRMDPRIYNGAILLGLSSLAVKSHGGADGFAFAQALKFTINVARQNLLARVKTYIDKLSSLEGILSS
jgi:glycerol-3-phosphate acyltransferase PlsX